MRIELDKNERFPHNGYMIHRLIINADEAAIYSRSGFVGIVKVNEVPEIVKALESRKPAGQ